MLQASGCLSCCHRVSLGLLLPHLAGVAVEAAVAGGRVRIWARARAESAACPRCGQFSERVHSAYERRLADAPAGGQPVTIRLAVRRFFCGNPDCAAVTRLTAPCGPRDARRRSPRRSAGRRSAAAPPIPKRTRREIARDLDLGGLVHGADRFLALLDRLWVLDDGPLGSLGSLLNPEAGLRAQIDQHVFRNPRDWSAEDLFENLGAFEASDRRFALFLEGLTSADVVPDESA